MEQAFREAVRSRAARVAVIGLGCVGLPLLEAFGRAGFPLLGLDSDRSKVERLRRGESYMLRVPSAWVRQSLDAGQLELDHELHRLASAAAVIICVPTPLTRAREPDLSCVRETAAEVSRRLERGRLVVLESTTYPGTTEDVVRPILEAGGLAAGADFFLAYSPEREDPGNRSFRIANIPKLVGGIDATSTRAAAELYGAAVERVVPVSHARVAEAAKLLENIYRGVNIALVNELKVVFDRMGLDIWEVIDAASTKPFGFQPFQPGPGLGGHCIPIDPFYLAWKARELGAAARLVELAGEINTRMPRHVAHKTGEALNARGKPVNGSRGLIIGVAYKPDTDDTRESPAVMIMELLEAQGAVLEFHDPYVPELPPAQPGGAGRRGIELRPEALSECDFVIIVTPHTGIDWSLVVERARLVIDTRNATRDVPYGREKVVKA